MAFAAAVAAGSPAEEAGIERGDVIAMIQDESTRTTPLYRAHMILAGEPGTKVELETIRLGVKDTVELELAEFPPPGAELTVRDGVGVLRIGGFHAETATNVELSLAAFSGDSFVELTDRGRLLIDLRGVAGGDEAAAYQVAAFFAAGELGVLTARGEVEESFLSEAEPRFTGRVVVLINRGTQGPAEVLATVLRQRLDATLVGAYSFGHSGRTRLVSLSNGGRLQITDAFYTGPDHEPIHEGLEPDVAVRPFATADEDAEDADPVLDKGLEVLLSDEEEAEAEKKRAA